MEYKKRTLQDYFCDRGIIHQRSYIDTPSQSGVDELKNQRLLEVARLLMCIMQVLKAYRDDVVLATTYLINRMPLRLLTQDLFNSYKEPLLM